MLGGHRFDLTAPWSQATQGLATATPSDRFPLCQAISFRMTRPHGKLLRKSETSRNPKSIEFLALRRTWVESADFAMDPHNDKAHMPPKHLPDHGLYIGMAGHRQTNP